jgi:hypothetical protein
LRSITDASTLAAEDTSASSSSDRIEIRTVKMRWAALQRS